jgi:hypothetical protein
MSKFRKIMIAVMLFGVAGTAIGAGTFASFSASTTNETSTFATGTLTLSNTVEGGESGTACLSSTGGVDDNANADCDVLFDDTDNLEPGSDPFTARLTLENTGTLDAETLNYAMSTCDPDDAAGTTVHGTGNPCGAIELYIQEYTDDDFTTTTGACVFPAGALDCATDFSGGSDLLTNVPSSGTEIAGGLTSTDARYFEIGARFSPDAENDMQGRQADFAFTWSLAQ